MKIVKDYGIHLRKKEYNFIIKSMKLFKEIYEEERENIKEFIKASIAVGTFLGLMYLATLLF